MSAASAPPRSTNVNIKKETQMESVPMARYFEIMTAARPMSEALIPITGSNAAAKAQMEATPRPPRKCSPNGKHMPQKHAKARVKAGKRAHLRKY